LKLEIKKNCSQEFDSKFEPKNISNNKYSPKIKANPKKESQKQKVFSSINFFNAYFFI